MAKKVEFEGDKKGKKEDSMSMENVNKLNELTSEEVISEINQEIEEKIPKTVKDDEIFISGKGLIKLKPTKLKHFKNGSYNNFMIIKNMGIHELLKYEDGEEILITYIGAALDIDKEQIDFIDEMSTKTLFELIEKMNKINEIKDTDFLKQLQEMEAITKE
jgi:hypothetical protein